MTFAQVVGMTSTNQSFSVAHAFISIEKVDNYLWVLERIKAMLVDCMEPRVIVTIKDFALMKTCDKIFPNAYKYLCQFLIQQSISRNNRKKFTDKEWKEFFRLPYTSPFLCCFLSSHQVWQFHQSSYL